MKRILKSETVAVGLAMFAMFFGAGNLIFPLSLGVSAGDKNIFAMLGLLITAVGVPFLGLVGMILYNGNYKDFVYRIGEVPGFALLFVIICLIGPFGALPRCVTVSYDALNPYLPIAIPLIAFSLLYLTVAYILSVRENKILTILGYFLSPLKLILLASIIIKGLLFSPQMPLKDVSRVSLFFDGLTTGYLTMDLLAAIFFSSVIIHILRSNLAVHGVRDDKKLAWMVLQSSFIGASLIAIIYIGMSFVAASYADTLGGLAEKQILAAIAAQVLGAAGGLITGIAVSFACLTTVIALAAASAEFISKDLFGGRINYGTGLLIALAISLAISTLEFAGIKMLLTPILLVSYPAIIVLTLCNIAYKLFGFRFVKVPFFLTFFASIFIIYGAQLRPLLGLAAFMISNY